MFVSVFYVPFPLSPNWLRFCVISPIFLKSQKKKKSQDNIEIFKYHMFVCVRCCIVMCTSQLPSSLTSLSLTTEDTPIS